MSKEGMSKMEDFEMDKRRRELDRDVEHLVAKYLRVFEWEIPESDEPRAKRLIIEEIRQTLDRLLAGQREHSS